MKLKKCLWEWWNVSRSLKVLWKISRCCIVTSLATKQAASRWTERRRSATPNQWSNDEVRVVSCPSHACRNDKLIVLCQPSGVCPPCLVLNPVWTCLSVLKLMHFPESSLCGCFCHIFLKTYRMFVIYSAVVQFLFLFQNLCVGIHLFFLEYLSCSKTIYSLNYLCWWLSYLQINCLFYDNASTIYK